MSGLVAIEANIDSCSLTTLNYNCYFLKPPIVKQKDMKATTYINISAYTTSEIDRSNFEYYSLDELNIDNELKKTLYKYDEIDESIFSDLIDIEPKKISVFAKRTFRGVNIGTFSKGTPEIYDVEDGES